MPSLSISASDLLKSGVHYGHRVSRWNPKMAPYIHARKSLIHIIDVRQTIRGLVRAWHFLQKLASRGDVILFVGTKRQAGKVIKDAAARCGMPYVAERWLGGTLTNYETIRTRLNRLKEIEEWEQDGTITRYSKKEQASIQREKRKLLRNLDGLRSMDRLPAALVLVDPRHESIAVSEAHKIGAATLALIDTDGDPEEIDIAIPGNDDSMKVVDIIVNRLADAVVEGKAHPSGPRVEEIEKAGAVSVSILKEEKPGAITVGKGGRPRRATTGHKGGPAKPPPASAPPPSAAPVAPSAPPPPAPAAPASGA